MECRKRETVPCVFLSKETKEEFLRIFEPIYVNRPDNFEFDGDYMVLKTPRVKMANGNPIRYRLNRWYVRSNLFSYEGLTQEAFERNYEITSKE